MAIPNSYGNPPDHSESGDVEESQESDSDTVLVDKSPFGDKVPTPGTDVTFTIVREYEDEVEMKLKDSGDMGDDSGTAESADRSLGDMAV